MTGRAILLVGLCQIERGLAPSQMFARPVSDQREGAQRLWSLPDRLSSRVCLDVTQLFQEGRHDDLAEFYRDSVAKLALEGTPVTNDNKVVREGHKSQKLW